MYQRTKLKSAVAFFFLFFLHGTSIGTRQQGISYNGHGFVQVGDFMTVGPELKHKSVTDVEDNK